MKLMQEFREFLNEYKILGLAVAFIIGVAATSLVQALVNDLIMPIVTSFIPAGAWQDAVFTIGSVAIKWGHFLSVAINFVIMAFVVFLIAKKVMKEEKVSKK